MVYANENSILAMIKFTEDETDTSLINTAMSNADSWVNARLLSNSLSIWTSTITATEVETTVNNETVTTTQNIEVIEPQDKPIPDLLKTAANYYAVSDILQSLYGAEDRSTNEEAYFEKAETMLNAYITQQKDLLASTELSNKNMVKHSSTPTYYQQKRKRKRR